MYQNSSIIPLESIDGSVKHICLIIYDVTDIAVNPGGPHKSEWSFSVFKPNRWFN